jgi:hypothetical protein
MVLVGTVDVYDGGVGRRGCAAGVQGLLCTLLVTAAFYPI